VSSVISFFLFQGQVMAFADSSIDSGKARIGSQRPAGFSTRADGAPTIF